MLQAPTDFGRDNQLRARMWFTMLLLGLVYAVFLFVLFRLGVGVGIMLVLAGGLALFQLLASDRMVLATMRAKVVTPEEQPELHRMVERLSLAAGIPKPKVAVADMRVPNAFATGRSQKTAAVAVTKGLMELLATKTLPSTACQSEDGSVLAASSTIGAPLQQTRELPGRMHKTVTPVFAS